MAQGFQKGNQLGNKYKKGNIPFSKGKLRSKEAIEKYIETCREKRRKRRSEAHKGHIPWNKGLKGLIPWNKGKKLGKGFYPTKNIKHLKKYQFQSGKNHWNWKGGIVKRSHHPDNKEYIFWRIGVFTRDDFICQICKKVGRGLEAHHIKSWSLFPKHRYEVWNGITLCENCHINANSVQRYLEKKGGTIKGIEKTINQIKKVNFHNKEE